MDVVFVGGGVAGAAGSVEMSLGQVFVAEGSAGGVSQAFGVQQPYSERCADSAAAELVQATGGYRWRGQNYTTSGTYTRRVHGVAAEGCDSVYTLRLSLAVDRPVPEIFTYDGLVLLVDHFPESLEGERVDWASYRWWRDGVLLSFNMADYFGILDGDEYQPLSGCFYVEVPADREGYWLHSNTLCLTPSKRSAAPMDLSLRPNPASRAATVWAVLSRVPEGSALELYDLRGRELYRRSTSGETELPLPPLPAGAYTVRLLSPDGTSLTKRLVVR